jgi:hypothetical protein
MATVGTSNSAAARNTEIAETIIGIYTNGVGRLADIQKKTLDLAQQQNAELTVTGKKLTQATHGTQASTVFDLAATMFGQYVDLQKGAIDLALEQSNSLATFVHEGVKSISKATDTITTSLQDGLDRAAATQRSAIEFGATQTRTFFDTFKKQSGVAGTSLETATESVQRGVDNLAETQKEILNIASKRTNKASA